MDTKGGVDGYKGMSRCIQREEQMYTKGGVDGYKGWSRWIQWIQREE